MGGGGVVEGVKPAAAMVMVEFIFSALQIFIKLALDDGMDVRVLVAYRLMFAAAFLCPLAFLVERKASGQAKLLGTLVGLGGAMVVTFYKGPEIKFLHHLALSRISHVYQDHHHYFRPSPSAGAQILGSFLAVTSCFSYAIWLTIQAKVGEVYPCHYSIAALVCLSGAIQSTLLALCIHRDMEHWRLGLNIRLYSSAYAGIVASGCAFPLMSWCLRKKGPLYVAMFGPLIVVFVAVLSSIFLDETLLLGIVLGAVLIVAGLYMVLWGKAKEEAADRLCQDEELGKASITVAAANGETK
ncbi:hypothetical protein E2562_024951 [Oryza meyeriana var. granulata]|uniref:WAT1-related protein n=1 Tax=Oryza meyeriana var. granulata TaxID=110450 RepID=A0A6G1DN62_9ORYZ|nr:hypothetical protein E2562_024951 [Oryza meyeriana var. granulata]